MTEQPWKDYDYGNEMARLGGGHSGHFLIFKAQHDDLVEAIDRNRQKRGQNCKRCQEIQVVVLADEHNLQDELRGGFI